MSVRLLEIVASQRLCFGEVSKFLQDRLFVLRVLVFPPTCSNQKKIPSAEQVVHNNLLLLIRSSLRHRAAAILALG